MDGMILWKVGEEKNWNISEYDIVRIKAKIYDLKHFYELVIHYIGFGNDRFEDVDRVLWWGRDIFLFKF